QQKSRPSHGYGGSRPQRVQRLPLPRPVWQSQQLRSRGQYVPLQDLPQSCGVKSVHRTLITHCREGALFSDESLCRRREPGDDGLTLELRMGMTEFFDDVFVFFRFRRASTIDQHPAGPQAWGNRFKDLTLEHVVSMVSRLAFPRLRFSMSPRRAEPAAGLINQNPIARFA